MRLKKVIIENFAGTKYREIDFGDHTEISGRNESGKTTVGNAYSWLMSDKLMSGGRADGIRPKENGTEIDDVEISVTAILDIDGREVEVKKQQAQNWNKKTGTLIGNTNTWMVNGVPKKAKEFTQFLEENIAKEDVIQFCTSAAPFLKLDSKKRREKLFSLIPDFTEQDVFSAYPELMPLSNVLRDGSVDELIARCRYQLKGRGRGDKGLEGQLDDIPIRIDEANRSLTDVPALEAEDSILDSDILFLNEKLKSLTSSNVEEIKANIKAVEMKMRQVEASENMKLQEQKANLRQNVFNEENALRCAENDLAALESDLRSRTVSLERNNKKITVAGEQWKKTKAIAFDDKKRTCAYCGQPLPLDKLQTIIDDFESKKAKQLQEIEDDGNAAKEAIRSDKSEITMLNVKITEAKKNIEKIQARLQVAKDMHSRFPETISMADNHEYQELSRQKDELMKSWNEPDPQEMYEIKLEIDGKQRRRLEIQSLILADVKARERIKTLEQERLNISQKIADVEKQLDMLLQFSKCRGELITERINSMFRFVEWDLFDFTIDGSSYTEICEPKYQGVRYSQLLNGGARILVEADICNTFQKQNGVSLPVFLDNAEAITADTRAKFSSFDFQSIFLQAAECDFTVR